MYKSNNVITHKSSLHSSHLFSMFSLIWLWKLLASGTAIYERSQRHVEKSDSYCYAAAGVVFALILATLPIFFRLDYLPSLESVPDLGTVHSVLFRNSLSENYSNASFYLSQLLASPSFLLGSLVLVRFLVWFAFFFLLSVADRAYKRRLFLNTNTNVLKIFMNIFHHKNAKMGNWQASFS